MFKSKQSVSKAKHSLSKGKRSVSKGMFRFKRKTFRFKKEEAVLKRHTLLMCQTLLASIVVTSFPMQPAMPTAASPADLSEGVNSSPSESINVCRTNTGGTPMLMRSYSQRDARDRDELFAKV